MVYAIFSQSKTIGTAPSRQYRFLGQLTETEVQAIKLELAPTFCQLKSWDDKQEFDSEMKKLDSVYYDFAI